MKLTVNGESLVYNGPPTLAGLLKELKVDANRVAIMVNDRVIARDKQSSTPVSSGDRIEFLTFAGGGAYVSKCPSA